MQEAVVGIYDLTNNSLFSATRKKKKAKLSFSSGL